jgi:hypothetical protein
VIHIEKIELNSIAFYSSLDEENFFAWVTKISCINRYDQIFDKLILDINTTILDRYEFIELSALFMRYKIDVTPLKILKQHYGLNWKTNLLDNYS